MASEDRDYRTRRRSNHSDERPYSAAQRDEQRRTRSTSSRGQDSRTRRRDDSTRSRRTSVGGRSSSSTRRRGDVERGQAPDRRREDTRRGQASDRRRHDAERRRGSSTRRQGDARTRSSSSRRRGSEQTRSASPARDQRSSSRGKKRIGGIDGFRALAIIAVVLYHLDVTWLPSGHLGVVMFLVLTGYLVTSSLLRRMRSGAGSIPRFWLQRLSRIWPPMALMMIFTILICIICNHVLLTKARPDVLPGLFMFENISYIVRGVSYFDQIGGPSPLTHLWYLGIDAQFCLVWPLFMLLGALLPSRSSIRRFSFLLAIASAVAMGLLFNPEGGTTRVYYGPDTRAFAPLLGAWLAYAIPLGKRPARDLRDLIDASRFPLEIAAFIALIALVVGMVFIPDTSVLLYRGGMFVAALCSVIILAAVVLPGGPLSAIFSLPPLTWLGSRSFGIYLWHYPLIQLFHAASNGTPWWRVLLTILLSLLLGELTYQLVEQPIARGTLGAAAAEQLTRSNPLLTPIGIGAIVLTLIMVGDGLGLALVPEETLVPEDAIVSTGDDVEHAKDLSKEPEVPQEDIPIADAVLRAPEAEKSAGIYDPVLIGDSVPGDAQAYWVAACPDGLIDSYVGRRPDQAMAVLDEYLEMGAVGKIVIIQAFSNTPATIDQIDHMVSACGPDRIVYLVNVRIPESEETQINRTLSEAVSKYDNVHLINWHALSEGQSDWIYPDGEHLTPTGQPIYINMLVEAIAGEFTAAGGTITRKSDSMATAGTGKAVVVDSYPVQETTDTSTESTDESTEYTDDSSSEYSEDTSSEEYSEG